MPDQYPAIKDFVRGYLHQDAMVDYGSAQKAAEQFCHDADRDQVEQLRSEWIRFSSRHANLDEINTGLQRLGSMWLFGSKDEFNRMLDTFSDAGK